MSGLLVGAATQNFMHCMKHSIAKAVELSDDLV